MPHLAQMLRMKTNVHHMGRYLFLDGRAISWIAKRHYIALITTAKVELMAAKEEIAQAIHLRA